MASEADKVTLACLFDRSSRPRRSPRELAAAEQARICEVREKTGWGPRLIAGVLGHPHSTISRTLERAGISRKLKAAREPANRYEWPCPGDLLHMDIKRYARFEVPGHALTGDRTVNSRGAGWEYSHSIVDVHSRLAYAEILDSQDAEAVLGFTERALEFFEVHGITVKRLTTDNAWIFTRSRKLDRLLRKKKIKHLLIKPRRPQTNGKVERFHQTMAGEWGYGLLSASSEHRRRALPYWRTTTTSSDHTQPSVAGRLSAVWEGEEFAERREALSEELGISVAAVLGETLAELSWPILMN